MIIDVPELKNENDLKLTREEVLHDFRIACESRETSLMGRKEVFMGKAKFGIFGDGKELAQIAMAKVFENGDWRSGYYRDQTFMFASGLTTIQKFFAQLYAHTNIENDPASGGRMMNGHYGTRLLDNKGNSLSQTDKKITSSDVSSTGGQMARIIGLGYASKMYRENPQFQEESQFSIHGNEVAFATIGNASTSEGIFYEAMNAIGVMQIPVITSVWDDRFGISVGAEHHTIKESISEALKGMQREEGTNGIEIFVVKGWDYPALVDAYRKAKKLAKEQHIPSLVHVIEMTQPQGHSTSGSHERYKTSERLEWEAEYDCIRQMRLWILTNEWATEEELEIIQKEAKQKTKEQKNAAWKAYQDSIQTDFSEALSLLKKLAQVGEYQASVTELTSNLEKTHNPIKKDIVVAIKKVLRVTKTEQTPERVQLKKWLDQALAKYAEQYSSHQISESADSPLKVPFTAARYSEDAPLVDGYEIINACFDKIFERDPRAMAFGEDVGKIGDVNQGMAGLQEKYGELRIHDTSIREMTIIGEGTGAALRGLRPIAEIQYLDYLVYALNTITDDIACLHYRTKGGQKAPVIIRTRGHRLEGVWHSGSPMSMILGSMRGMHVLVPRNLTQAAGFYNTLMKGDDPALVIECLNAYRLKERMPENLGEYTLPLGLPETLKEGADITIVTYGAMCRIIMDAANQLEEAGISLEVIDVQSLLPFDRNHMILESIKKTNRVIFADEDAPGGASAYMMQKVMDEQGAYHFLDSKPICIAAQPHRPAYGTDGDYFSKPSAETIFEKAYDIMNEVDPSKYPELY